LCNREEEGQVRWKNALTKSTVGYDRSASYKEHHSLQTEYDGVVNIPINYTIVEPKFALGENDSQLNAGIVHGIDADLMAVTSSIYAKHKKFFTDVHDQGFTNPSHYNEFRAIYLDLMHYMLNKDIGNDILESISVDSYYRPIKPIDTARCNSRMMNANLFLS
jgi:hypothetical protein